MVSFSTECEIDSLIWKLMSFLMKIPTPLPLPDILSTLTKLYPSKWNGITGRPKPDIHVSDIAITEEN